MIFASCEQKREALGADNEIRIICSDLDKEIISKAMSRIFYDTLYSPQPEPYYYLRFSDPDTYNDLKEQAYIVIGAINRESENPSIPLLKKLLPKDQFVTSSDSNPIMFARNVYAQKQLFMVINASSVEQLMNDISEKKEWIRKQFFDQFIARQTRFLFNDDGNRILENKIMEEHGWTIKIPWGWELIRNSYDSNFVWIGREMPFQWISIHYKDGFYVDNKLMAGNYIWNWPKNYYKSIQFNDYQFQLRMMKFKGNNAWRGDGVWETIDKQEAKGGPFRSYLFYDLKTHRTYHINILIHNPGNDKSIYLRQLDMIVKTFRRS